MATSSRAFLLAVMRYRTLLARRGAPGPELDHLQRYLSTDAPDAGKSPHDRRRYRRCEMNMQATARVDGTTTPCTVVDVSGGGLRIVDDHGTEVEPGSQIVVSLEPGPTPLRIDLPAEVRYVGNDGFGVKFSGPPLFMRRSTGRSPRSAKRGSATAETPRATDDSALAA